MRVRHLLIEWGELRDPVEDGRRIDVDTPFG